MSTMSGAGWVLVEVTLGVWAAMENVVVVRERWRGQGGKARDRGTRTLIKLGIVLALGGAVLAARQLRYQGAWQLGGWTLVPGLVVAWTGLALRFWAIAVLGRSFRTTVEVDAGQPVVDRGPYRCVRHPSYSGLLIFAMGIGLALGNWLSLLLVVAVLPVVIVRRIAVEEAALTEVLGQPYRDYQTRTKRLIPRLW